jgi:hypothetical protein
MRYEIAIALLSAALLGASWALRRHRLALAIGERAVERGARPPLAAIRRRPF